MSVPKLRFKEFDGDWGKTTILDISTLVTKGTTPKVFVEGRINFLKIEAINGNSFDLAKCQTISDEIHEKELKRSILQEGDILFAIAGATIGKNAIVTESILPANTNQALAIIRLDDKDGKEFVSKVLNSPLMEKYIESSISTGAQPNLNLQQIGNFAFNLPSKPEQTKIASFLSAVDEKISQLTQKHALLSQYKQGMMQKLFSQQIRFKADDGSEFGEWETKSIKDVADVKGGKRIPKGYALVTENTGHPYITVSDMNRSYSIDSTNIRYVPLEVVDTIKRYTITDKDIFISVAGTLGIIGKIPTEFNGANLTENADKLTNLKCHQNFLIYLLDSGYLSELIESTATTSAQPKLALYAIEQLEIHIPCLEEQTKIANFLSAIDQKIEVVAQQIEQAKQWKKGLLQQMFV